MPDDAAAHLEDLLEGLRQRIAERQASGEYPEGLADELDAHFRRATRFRPDETEAVRRSLDRVEETMAFALDRIPVASDVPGGQLAHKAVTKIVSRQAQGVLQQVREYADAVYAALSALVVAVEMPGTHTHVGTTKQLEAILERLAHYERMDTDGAFAAADLRRRVEVLEQAEARRQFNPWYLNERFEGRFRGNRADLVESYRDLAQGLHGCDPVLDIGYGRGEFLELLAEIGVKARGVEIDTDLVESAVARGLDVEHGDGLTHLASETDGSLGGLVLLQVIEHFSRQEVVDLVALSAEKVRPGGKVIVETVNPESLYVFAHALFVDPTHDQPVHPAYLQFLFTEAGFEEVRIEPRSPVPDDERLQPDPDGGRSPRNRNVERLNRLLYGPQDYAVVAIR